MQEFLRELLSACRAYAIIAFHLTGKDRLVLRSQFAQYVGYPFLGLGIVRYTLFQLIDLVLYAGYLSPRPLFLGFEIVGLLLIGGLISVLDIHLSSFQGSDLII